jgi:hypothetical protein
MHRFVKIANVLRRAGDFTEHFAHVLISAFFYEQT